MMLLGRMDLLSRLWSWFHECVYIYIYQSFIKLYIFNMCRLLFANSTSIQLFKLKKEYVGL